MGNTPEPCNTCKHLYYDCMQKDDPNGEVGCNKDHEYPPKGTCFEYLEWDAQISRKNASKYMEWVTTFKTDKVIVRSNDDEFYQVGVLDRFDRFPTVVINNELLICMGIVVPYDDVLARLLGQLTHKQQWEILSKISLAVQIHHRK